MAINYIVIRKRSRKAVKRILNGLGFTHSLDFSDARNSFYRAMGL